MDPDKATGKPHTLWVAFAKLYERHGDLPNARIIFEKATQASAAPGARPAGLPLQACAAQAAQGSALCPTVPRPPPCCLCTKLRRRRANMLRPIVHCLSPPLPPAQARFKFVDDLATVWCEWAEMELRHKNFKRALEAMRRATQRPARPRTREVRRGSARAPLLESAPRCKLLGWR